jgi:hypothetical protein
MLHRQRFHGRQAEDKGAALAAARAAGLQCSAMQFGERTRQGQADAQTAFVGPSVVALHEEIEDVLEVPGRDAAAIVGHGDRRESAGALDLQDDVSSVGCVLGGVDQEVLQDLGNARQVGIDVHRLLGQLDLERVPPGLDQGPCRFGAARHDFTRAQHLPAQLDLSRRQPPDIEQVVDQTGHLGELPVDDVATVAQGGTLERLQLHDRDRVANRRQRVAQLVREHRQELAHTAARTLQLFQAAAVRHVPRDLCESDQLPAGAVHRGDDRIGPEQRAVLANAPALGFKAAVALRDPQFTGRFAVGLVLRGIEGTEVPPDDLGGRVALERMRPGVPAANGAIHVQHVDRVVAHAFHQQAEPLFAGAQFLLVPPALAQVARHLGEARKLAGSIVDGRDDDVGPEPAAVLAHPPALILETAQLARPPQFLIGPAGRDSFRRIEHGEMLPQDFLAGVALQFFRADVPGDDMPLGVENEDAVVHNRFDQQLQPVFDFGRGTRWAQNGGQFLGSVG